MPSIALARRASNFALFTATAGILAALAWAGPLNPPAGPVTSTQKPLAEVEPRIAINATNTPGDADSVFKITQPGSYYLTSNFTGEAGKNGIEIAASGVTLDLNGFTLTGVPGASSGIIGVDDVRVKNGTVTDWTNFGIAVNTRSHVADVIVKNCQNRGISAGVNSIVDSCIASECGVAGIDGGPNSIVRNCTASDNVQDGIAAASLALVEHCNLFRNGGNGIAVSSSARVEHCASSFNSGAGISMGGDCSAVSCTSSYNTGAGITAGDQARIRDCEAHRNTAEGIRTTDGAYITNCLASVNLGAGISVGSGCKVESNHCRFSGAGPTPQAGILVRSGSNRSILLDNNCLNNDWGIKIEGTFCLVTGNTCGVNTTTNFEIAASNRVATILTVPTSGAISGNTGGTAITDPQANFAY